MLSACGGGQAKPSSNPGAETPKPSAEQKPITLKMWGGVPPESGPQEAVDNWNKANPNIKVEYTRFVNDESGNLKLETALLSNNDAPDIFVTYSDSNMTKRVQASMAIPLDDLIAKEKFDVEGIIGSANFKKFPDGKIYYLPANKNVSAILFNQKALDEIGEKVPTSWTWDEFEALAKKLNKGDRKGFATDPALGNLGDAALLTAKPVDRDITADGTSNYNHAAVKKGLEIQKRLEDSGVMVKYSEAVANKLTAQNELLTGKAAMVMGGIYLLRYVKDTKAFPHDFPVSFAPIPQWEKGGNVNSGGVGDYLSISKNSPNKEAAFRFISWYLTEGNMSMLPGGRIPTSKKADAAKITTQLIGDAPNLVHLDSLKSLLSANYKFQTSYDVPASTELKAIFKEESEKYLLNAQNIDKTLEVMKSRSDAAIKAAKK